MIRRKLSLKSFILCAVFLLSMASVSICADKNPVLARIGDEKITSADLDRVIGYYSADQQKQFRGDPQMRAALLRRIVQGKVLADIARSKGFDKLEDIREQLRFLVNDYLAMEFVRREVISKIEVSEDDKKLYYKTYRENFMTPEMVKAAHILIRLDNNASEDEKKCAREKAEDILERLKKGEDFAKLATEFSEDPASRDRGGDLGFFPRGTMTPDFEEVVFSLKPGETSGIVETHLGFHIIKLEERKAPELRPYEEVEDKIESEIFKQAKKSRVEDFIEEAMEESGVEFEPIPPGGSGVGQP
jgi:peptidyl-prolyl cis-trans isomerase C